MHCILMGMFQIICARTGAFGRWLVRRTNGADNGDRSVRISLLLHPQFLVQLLM